MANNSNQFSRFDYVSPLSSIPHDPPVTLASNCIRDYFGPTVQWVADCLIARGGESTLAQILSTIESKEHPKQRTHERREILRLANLRPSSTTKGCPSVAAVRASLLVLVQHSLVVVRKTTKEVKSIHPSAKSTPKRKTVYTYRMDPDEARILHRYPRLVEFIKKALDDTAATLVEELLLQGRMQTVDAIVATVEQLQHLREDSAGGGTSALGEPDITPSAASISNLKPSDRYTTRQSVLESFARLVRAGFIQQIPVLKDPDLDEEEFELDSDIHQQQKQQGVNAGNPADGDGSSPPPAKKRRIENNDSVEDPAVVTLLQTGPYKTLPRDAVWKVNTQMIHEQLRAVSLGWLVAERYNHKIQSSGSIVTAALKLASSKRHTSARKLDYETTNLFTVTSILRYLPKAVLQNFEKKEGGVVPNIHKALVQLSHMRSPSVVEEVEVAPGQPENAKFQILTNKLVDYLRDRIVHQIVLDSHGEIAARICSILKTNGFMESDAVAEAAMVPAKDTREVLHRLYREKYIDLFNINQGKQHNPSSMIYLWGISRARCTRNVADNVCTALCNMRLRRQHEMEVGNVWVERARDPGAQDENENEADKLMYSKFCQGLERLDNAAVQLDETLMVLMDY